VTTTTTSDELWAAVETFDAEAAELVIARLLWDVPLSGAVTGVMLPFLREVGDRWEDGTLSVAHEHFVSDMLRRELSALAAVPPRAPDGTPAPGPVVLLACPPGERHDMVLLCVALMLRERGVRVRFLGADTPIPAVLTAARRSAADEQTVAEIGARTLPDDPVRAVVALVGELAATTGGW
jgi:MerR family transcriptional regulator, light-induced transcriptional regulator